MSRLATRVIHEGYKPEPLAGCVSPPIYLSTTYAQESVGEHKGFEYARSNNPNREILEKNISALENAVGSCAFSTGMAAISTLVLSLEKGSHIIVSSNVYGGTYRVFTKVFQNHGLEFSFVSTKDLEALQGSLRPNTRLIFVETPTNPLMEITDIQAIADFAHENGIRLCVDNTFMTPIFQRPLELGADFVIHSATKYLGGHSDVLGGLICLKNKEDYETLKFLQKSVGNVLAPFDSWLILRGIRTLDVRMQAHERNANKVVNFLDGHCGVEKIYYPGVENHPNREVGLRQSSGYGGMISFELKNPDRLDQFLKRLEIFTLAESLGAVESLVCIPALMTHASVPAEERVKLGIKDTLIRLSIGIEDPKDLIEDLDKALKE
jgi:cystathionine gamma-lyase / homocysteine desulfhydrase